MVITTKKILRPDSKGRINLGKIAEGISGYLITQEEDGRLILEPQVEIPEREMWLYKNKKALKQVEQGLKDATEGRLYDLGDFTQFVDEE